MKKSRVEFQEYARLTPLFQPEGPSSQFNPLTIANNLQTTHDLQSTDKSCSKATSLLTEAKHVPVICSLNIMPTNKYGCHCFSVFMSRVHSELLIYPQLKDVALKSTCNSIHKPLYFCNVMYSECNRLFNKIFQH